MSELNQATSAWHPLCDKKAHNPGSVMINTNPNSGYSQLRVASVAIALVALFAAVSGSAGSATVLTWAVAAIALTTFAASFYLKN
ncbi:hypothetical protein EI77_03662 [Prosthecobacter fusiformis]|uniref:Uncharacterized protein n=1 Tax=Prosthecobacter fusiformis TaxID=48464 RepID=A0A4R7RQK6_9BACT|nr:hypothetical protein EI77_03662 [Prosthecobacter fusiformis]